VSVGSTAKRWFHWLVAHSGVPWIARHTLQRFTPGILVYHDPAPEILHAHLEFLRSRFEVVTLREVLAWLCGERDALPPRSVAITLDDGWAGNSKLEHVFRQHDVIPTVFVCSQIVGTARTFWWQHASPAEVRDLKQMDDDDRVEWLASRGYREEEASGTGVVSLGVEELRTMLEWADVQSHTRFHPILPQCGDSRAWREIAGSREELSELLDSDVYALAYPNGDYSARDARMAREAGYRCAVTIDEGHVKRDDDAFRLRRVGVSDTASPDELAVRVCGIHDATRNVLRRMRLLPQSGR